MTKILLIGTGGLAKQCISTITAAGEEIPTLIYYDNVTENPISFGFPVITQLKELKRIITINPNEFSTYHILISNPSIKQHFKRLITDELCSTAKPGTIIAKGTDIQTYSKVGVGCIFLGNSLLEATATIGDFVLVNYSAKIHHDCIVGDFTEISPGATLLGGVTVGDCCRIGANATILPGINLGDNVTVGAGAVVTKNVPSNNTVMGIPAK